MALAQVLCTVGSGHRSEAVTSQKFRNQGWRVSRTKVGAPMTPAQEGANSGPQKALQRLAK